MATSLEKREHWDVPVPSDFMFIAKVRELVIQADIDARALAQDFPKLPKKKISRTRISRSDSLAQPLTGICKACGYPRTEWTRGCETCYQRHYNRDKVYGISRPGKIDRVKQQKPEIIISDAVFASKRNYRRTQGISDDLAKELYEFYEQGWSCAQIMEHENLWEKIGYSNSHSGSVSLANKFHKLDLAVRTDARLRKKRLWNEQAEKMADQKAREEALSEWARDKLLRGLT